MVLALAIFLSAELLFDEENGTLGYNWGRLLPFAGMGLLLFIAFLLSNNRAKVMTTDDDDGDD